MTTRLDRFRRWMWGRALLRHLPEDHLVALALDISDEPVRRTAAVARHLRVCGRCERRLDELSALLKTIPEVAGAGFDEVFTPHRLQAQRARIGHRLAHLVGTIEPARVLAFPFCARPFRRLDFHPGRWLVAAAAAGLVIGITAGQLIQYRLLAPRTAGDPASAPRSAADIRTPLGMLDMTGTIQFPTRDGDHATESSSSRTVDEFERVLPEEEFLGRLDLALTNVLVSELESIDALTPRVRDLSSSTDIR